jgi:glycosyltransferase involved in cell wall biosynthesis
VRGELEREGCDVRVISPDLFRNMPCPTYSEIRLALTTCRRVGRMIEAIAPDSLHIATEGPLGLAARRWAIRRGARFTTAYHTQFPDYVAKRTKLPASWFWKYISWFHRPAAAVMVSTPTMQKELAAHGLPSTRLWGRGVDLACFTSEAGRHPAFEALPKPVQLYVGRVAIEKNIGAFLGCAHPGSKVVVGDGPGLAGLRKRHPDVLFLGALRGRELAAAYASADVFVFPSRTDTFGLVMIEALACGTPVAAYPVPGPLDVLTPETGVMHADLDTAIASALRLDRAACAAYGRGFSWETSARQFRAALEPLGLAAEQVEQQGDYQCAAE